jgi:hypothetical protein
MFGVLRALMLHKVYSVELDKEVSTHYGHYGFEDEVWGNMMCTLCM